MALLHKGLPFNAIPWRFTEKEAIAFSGQGAVPVIVDGSQVISDKWAIAEYLEDAYPERPSLFRGETGRALAFFVTNWAAVVLTGGIIRFILTDIFNLLHEKDKVYFRQSREKRFGMALEDVTKDRASRVVKFRSSLQPLRLSLARAPYLSGDTPAWADYVAFGPFQWARSVSHFALIEPNDPVFLWRARMIDLFGQAANQVHVADK
jgi:glutathione S-transferase